MEQQQTEETYFVMLRHILIQGSWVMSKPIVGEKALLDYLQVNNYEPHLIRIIKGVEIKVKSTIEVENIFQKHANPDEVN